MQRRLLPVALLAWVLTPPLEAQPESAYAGVSIGELEYSEITVGQRFNDSADSWRVMIGYGLTKHFALEASYGETSTVHATVPGSPPPTELGLEAELSKIVTIRGLGTFPFESGLSLMVGLGFFNVERNIAVSANGVALFSAERDEFSNPAYYAGVQYDWDRVALRLSYENFELDNSQSDAKEVALTFSCKFF